MIAHALALAAMLTTQSPVQQEVIGHYYACSATLALTRGKLSVRRSLTDQGTALAGSDSAIWEPADHVSGYLRWYAGRGQTYARLSEISGMYSIDVRTDRRLPKIASWELGIMGLSGGDSLALAMTTQADPLLGHAAMPLRVLLAYAGAKDKISWKLMDARGRTDGTRRQHAEGIIDAAALREAAEAIPRAEATLDALAAAPAEKCSHAEILYDESSIT
jgi:hypothetical protein